MLSVPEGVVVLQSLEHHAAKVKIVIKCVVLLSLGLECWADRLQTVIVELQWSSRSII